MTTRTQVGIIGAGPAGLMLSHMLHLKGISSVVLEARGRDYVLGRIRAGVLEQGTVDLLRATGLGDRMDRIGMPMPGIDIAFDGARRRIDFADLVGRQAMVYGQTEIVKDLIDAHEARGAALEFDAPVTAIEGADGPEPTIHYEAGGQARSLACDIVAGCDGFHGVSRAAMPAALMRTYARDYPYSWLGILAQAPPANDVVIYGYHAEGFALLSMRSPDIGRLYIQVPNGTDAQAWADEDIWAALERRLGGLALPRGPVLQKGVTPMRSFVAAPMAHGRLFLAGDAAHIVPPTGAKGLNLAMSDVAVLAQALVRHYSGDSSLLGRYSDIVLARVWKAVQFSNAKTQTMHIDPRANGFDARMQRTELAQLVRSRAAQTAFAEQFTGLPVAHAPDFGA